MVVPSTWTYHEVVSAVQEHLHPGNSATVVTLMAAAGTQ
jgi:hypothetical protein